jgi:curved DNA-binding protein CbpA
VASSRDPYAVLGVAPDASEAELRASYRRLVQLHHPDHNAGSAESARRFEEVQDAYAEIRRLRRSGVASGGGSAGAGSGRGRTSERARPRGTGTGTGTSPPDPNLDDRLAEMERRLREANLARERARRAAREAAAAADARRPPRASDEDLGYVKTDDSLAKILSDARDQLFGAASDVRDEVREHRVADRAADALEDIAARLRGEHPESSSEERS